MLILSENKKYIIYLSSLSLTNIVNILKASVLIKSGC